MSGGHFGYRQDSIRDIADAVERLIDYNDSASERNLDVYAGCYSEEVIERFKEGLRSLRRAEVFAQRIDWLVSGDDGEEAFQERLIAELDLIEKELR